MNKVYLIGAGTGGVDLLTLKAFKILQNQAEVVVYDRLISMDIIDIINPAAEKIFAGKEPDFHYMQQGDINLLLVTKAKLGKCVVRLKGGDPFIFGRGGEEIEILKQHNISVEVIPGISAAQSAAANFLIPLTYRNIADGVIYLSGHNYKDEMPNLDYKFLAQTKNTIVIYMGIKNSAIIAEQMIKNGANKFLDCAVIQNIGLDLERKIYSNLVNLSADIVKNNITNPAIIIIGDVVKKSREFLL
jgi:uroporphyrin-III C-methyltransferase